ASTQFLLAITNVLTHYGLFILGALVAGGLLFKAWVSTDAGATARDAFLFRLPIAGPVIKKAVVSRFARVLGTLVYGGVPILESIHISGMSAGNRTFGKGAEQVENDVREGRSIAEAMRDAG